MAAGIKDDVYLADNPAIQVTKEMRQTVGYIKAVVALFNDPMNDPNFNPDVLHCIKMHIFTDFLN